MLISFNCYEVTIEYFIKKHLCIENIFYEYNHITFNINHNEIY
jgi:hypothetical protein